MNWCKFGKYAFLAAWSSAMLAIMALFFSVPIVVFRNHLDAEESAFLGIQAALLFLFISAVFFCAKWIKNRL